METTNGPTPRQYHTACVYKNEMYVLGGAGQKTFNDFYSFQFGKISTLTTDRQTPRNGKP